MNNSKHTVIEVDTNLVEIEKGFNPREAVIGDLCYEQEPVKSMIVSIKQAFKEGRQVDMIKVVKRKGKYLVRQGHTRFHGLKLAISEGANIPKLSVILIDYKNEIEEYLENLDGNRSNGLNPVGQAHALAHAVSLGYSVEELAMRYQRSTTAIRNMLKILDMPLELQRLISLNLIKKTLAIEIMLKYSNDHKMVLKHIEGFLPGVKNIETTTSKIVGIPEHNAAGAGPDTLNKGGPEKKNSAVTRKTLGIKRLSHKKTERLKSEFLELVESTHTESITNTQTELKFGKDSAHLFKNVNSKNVIFSNDGVQIILNDEKLNILLSLLNDENTAIIVSKPKLEELLEIRDLLKE